jgi:hypothetical protein
MMRVKRMRRMMINLRYNNTILLIKYYTYYTNYTIRCTHGIECTWYSLANGHYMNVQFATSACMYSTCM